MHIVTKGKLMQIFCSLPLKKKKIVGIFKCIDMICASFVY
jgi:hypothetical protein